MTRKTQICVIFPVYFAIEEALDHFKISDRKFPSRSKVEIETEDWQDVIDRFKRIKENKATEEDIRLFQEDMKDYADFLFPVSTITPVIHECDIEKLVE